MPATLSRTRRSTSPRKKTTPKTAAFITLDTEATGLQVVSGKDSVYAVSLCNQDGKAWFWQWPVDPFTRQVKVNPKDVKEIITVLKQYPVIVFHNANFDIAACRTIGIDILKLFPLESIEDTIIASHVCDSSEPCRHRLKPLGRKYLGIDTSDEDTLHEITKVIRKNAPEGWQLSEDVEADYWLLAAVIAAKTPECKRLLERLKALLDGNTDRLEEYAVLDAVRTAGLWKIFRAVIEKHETHAVYRKRIACVPVLLKTQKRGLTVLPTKLKSEIKRYATARCEHERHCLKMVPKGFNLNSDKQLRELLFDKWKMPVRFKTAKGAPSVNAEALKQLHSETDNKKVQAFLDHLLLMRRNETACTYATGYYNSSIKGRLFPSINLTGTVTTRCSSNNPNGQNVGKGKEFESEDGEKQTDFKLRTVFGPARGRIWYSMDYQQLQLRIFAYLTKEQSMIDAFKAGMDFHNFVGSVIFECDPNDLTKLQRRIAKNVNFGYIFGATDGKIEATCGMKGLSARLKKLFPNVTEHMAYIKDLVRRTGRIHTMGGYPLQVDRQKAYAGVCYQVQGTEGEIVQDAMVRCDNVVDSYSLINPETDGLMLQVHDELDFDLPSVHQSIYERDGGLIRQLQLAMEAAGEALGIVTPVNVERIKTNWAEGTEIHWQGTRYGNQAA